MMDRDDKIYALGIKAEELINLVKFCETAPRGSCKRCKAYDEYHDYCILRGPSNIQIIELIKNHFAEKKICEECQEEPCICDTLLGHKMKLEKAFNKNIEEFKKMIEKFNEK